MAKVWGAVTPGPCYHTDPGCPVIRDNLEAEIRVVREYENEDAAFAAGHTDLCPLCRKAIIIQDEELKMVRLTVEQIDTMRVIRDRYDDIKNPLTLSTIAKARKRRISTCFTIVNALVKKGMLVKRLAKSGKATNGSIIPTPAGRRVLVKALAEINR